jgi:hypothetical protein
MRFSSCGCCRARVLLDGCERRGGEAADRALELVGEAGGGLGDDDDVVAALAQRRELERLTTLRR